MNSGNLNDALESAREIARTTVAREVEKTDRDAVWCAESFRAAMDAGLGGLVVPVEYGGLGLGLGGITRVCEILGYQSGSFAISFGMHCVGSAVIAAKATRDQVEHYLEPICAGKHITSLALSEPGTGIHFYFPETTLTPIGDGRFELNGVKSFATNGGHADSYVISSASGAARAEPGEFSCIALPAATPGIEWGAPFNGFGMRGNSSRTFRLNGVRIDRQDLLGEEGDQIWYVFQVVAPYFLMAMAGTYLGIAHRAVDESVSHLKERHYSHSGQDLGQQTVLQHRLGILWAKLQRSRHLAYWAADAGDQGDPEALPAIASAKAEIGDCAVDLTNEAMTLAGGRAYGENALLARLLRDARAAHVMAPTTDILRTWTGRSLLEVPLLGE